LSERQCKIEVRDCVLDACLALVWVGGLEHETAGDPLPILEQIDCEAAGYLQPVDATDAYDRSLRLHCGPALDGRRQLGLKRESHWAWLHLRWRVIDAQRIHRVDDLHRGEPYRRIRERLHEQRLQCRIGK